MSLDSSTDQRHDRAFNTFAVHSSNVLGLALQDGLETKDGITTTR